MRSADLAQRVQQAKRRADGVWYDGLCPAHDDATASLSWCDGDTGIVLKCHTGCTNEKVAAALKLTMRDLFFSTNGDRDRTVGRPIVATYDYTDAAGTLRYQVVRFDPKGFRVRRPDGAGGWIWDLKGVDRVLYHLHELQGRTIVAVTEGEKDADRLGVLGLTATTNPGGAGKWTLAHTQQLVDAGVKTVPLFRDNDRPGHAHAEIVAASLASAGLTVSMVLDLLYIEVEVLGVAE